MLTAVCHIRNAGDASGGIIYTIHCIGLKDGPANTSGRPVCGRLAAILWWNIFPAYPSAPACSGKLTCLTRLEVAKDIAEQAELDRGTEGMADIAFDRQRHNMSGNTFEADDPNRLVDEPPLKGSYEQEREEDQQFERFLNALTAGITEIRKMCCQRNATQLTPSLTRMMKH